MEFCQCQVNMLRVEYFWKGSVLAMLLLLLLLRLLHIFLVVLIEIAVVRFITVRSLYLPTFSSVYETRNYYPISIFHILVNVQF